jgi:uncharacterized OB-fold protein
MIYSAPRNGREATPHWKAAKERRLVMPVCEACGCVDWPPAEKCRRCGGAIRWDERDGGGRILTYSVVRRAVQPAWKAMVPYVVAFVELDGGGRLLSNVVDCTPDDVRIGARVTCDFVETSDPELGLPVFRLDRPPPAA